MCRSPSTGPSVEGARSPSASPRWSTATTPRTDHDLTPTIPSSLPGHRSSSQLSFADIPAARAGEAELVAALPPYDPPVPLDVDELLVPGPSGTPDVRPAPVPARRPTRDHSPGWSTRSTAAASCSGSPTSTTSQLRRSAADVGAVVVSVGLPARAGTSVPAAAGGLLRRAVPPGGRPRHRTGPAARPDRRLRRQRGSRTRHRASPCSPGTAAARRSASSTCAARHSTTAWTTPPCADLTDTPVCPDTARCTPRSAGRPTSAPKSPAPTTCPRTRRPPAPTPHNSRACLRPGLGHATSTRCAMRASPTRSRLLAAGVHAELHVYPGHFHSCTWLSHTADLPEDPRRPRRRPAAPAARGGPRGKCAVSRWPS